MKKRHNGGFSLVEVLVAIVILAIIVVPACSAMVLSARMNAKAEATLRARLAVSSALETMMAEGIDKTKIDSETQDYDNLGENSNLKIVIVEKTSYYDVTVTDNDDLVSITTKIREATP